MAVLRFTPLKDKMFLAWLLLKSYVGIWFFQGVFLSDSQSIWVNAQEGVTKRCVKFEFQSIEEMDTSILLEYFHEAIQNQKKGKN